jgi:hypothetical protein
MRLSVVQCCGVLQDFPQYAIVCEGTRVNEEFSKTESDVEKDVTSFANETQELVVCTYPEETLIGYCLFIMQQKNQTAS